MQLNNKRIMNGWVMYDWANSAFSLTIATAVFPGFFESVVPERVNFLGFEWVNTSLYAFMVSFAFLLVAIISPILSGIADYKGNKKSFMKFFCYTGSLSCIAMALFNGENLHLGVWSFVIAMLSFAGSIVFYNAYLPEIVTADKADALSAKGYSRGYIGSVLLLIINLVMIQKPALFGLQDGKLPAQISFITVGLWWAGFAQIAFRRLPAGTPKEKVQDHVLVKGFRELRSSFLQAKQDRYLFLYLIAFFVFSMGLQTVMYIAPLFGKKEIGLEMSQLIITVLIIQLVAVGGSHFFAWVSRKKGNIYSLSMALFIWVIVCVYAYYLPKLDFTGFYIIGALVGFVMGGIQALARSAYSKLLPPAREHTAFFSFYDVVEKISIVLGTFVWGLLEQMTGDMRTGVVALGIFFIIGWIILVQVKSPKLMPAEAEVVTS